MDFPRPTQYVKFKGPFTELKKNGWTFQKLFGRNYRSYKKNCDGEEHGGTTLRIWQHLGGYLEIDEDRSRKEIKRNFDLDFGNG